MPVISCLFQAEQAGVHFSVLHDRIPQQRMRLPEIFLPETAQVLSGGSSVPEQTLSGCRWSWTGSSSHSLLGWKSNVQIIPGGGDVIFNSLCSLHPLLVHGYTITMAQILQEGFVVIFTTWAQWKGIMLCSYRMCSYSIYSSCLLICIRKLRILCIHQTYCTLRDEYWQRTCRISKWLDVFMLY